MLFGGGENGSHSSVSHDGGVSLEDGRTEEGLEWVVLVSFGTVLFLVGSLDGACEAVVARVVVWGFALAVVEFSLSYTYAGLPTGSSVKAPQSSASHRTSAVEVSAVKLRVAVFSCPLEADLDDCTSGTDFSVLIFPKDSRPPQGSYS